jgi:hypothetical protein
MPSWSRTHRAKYDLIDQIRLMQQDGNGPRVGLNRSSGSRRGEVTDCSNHESKSKGEIEVAAAFHSLQSLMQLAVHHLQRRMLDVRALQDAYYPSKVRPLWCNKWIATKPYWRGGVANVDFTECPLLLLGHTKTAYSQLALLFKGGQIELSLNSTESLNTTVCSTVVLTNTN